MENQVFEEIDNRQDQINNAEAMQRLVDNDDFKKLFNEIFIEAFAITNTYNFANYDDDTKRRTIEKMAARSHFTNFVEDVLNEGRAAIVSLHEEQDDAKEEETY
ncbi:MAG: hypothetical protein DRQ78_10605 [Epsilonproteobacteria bacterium]|nr:MAG: hypothetical protein DRQ78_10605 [Campylobacterota bacterium]